VLIVLNKQRRLSRERYGSNRRYYVSRNLITWSRVPLRNPYRSPGPGAPTITGAPFSPVSYLRFWQFRLHRSAGAYVCDSSAR